MSIPALPQYDPNPRERRAALEARRRDYALRHDLLGGVALAAELPDEQRPTLRWWAEVAEAFAEILSNAAALAVIEAATFDNDEDDERLAAAGFARYRDKLGELFTGGASLRRLINYSLQACVASCTRGEPSSLADYEGLFSTVRLPAIARRWQEDRVFARMRLAGPNPVILRGIDGRLPPHFPVGEAEFARAVGTGTGAGVDSLAAALAEGRAYLCDYVAVEGMTPGRFPARQKYVSAPLALFVVPPVGARDRALRPIAIQCQQRPAADNPIFTPADGYAWLQAKLAVQTAEGNLHQTVDHLGHTHLLLGTVALAMRRQLAQDHPLCVLLDPHVEGTMFINEQAKVELIAEGGGIDYILNGTIAASEELTSSSVFSWRLSERVLPSQLSGRGVDDVRRLPDYPYRDDAVLLWGAIERWVADYARVYYRCDADVRADHELQAFAADLVAEDGGRLRAYAEEGGGRFVTIEDLVRFVAHVVFTASVQHAAVNFPQYDIMTYAPAFPLAQYAPTPSRAQDSSLGAVLRQLPSLQAAHVQLALGLLLGDLEYTRLGDYPRRLLRRYFRDDRVHDAQDRFVAQLESLQSRIEVRDAQRWMSYPYLFPDRIPQSINA